MASSALFLLLFITITISSPILLQIHARHIDFISKIPTRRLETVKLLNTEQPQPEFVRQNQDGHGLYGHKNIHSSETKSDNVEIETEDYDDQSQTKKGSIGRHNYNDELIARYNAYRAAVKRQRLRGSSSAMKDSRSFANGKHFYVQGKEQNQNAAFKATVQSQNIGASNGMSDARSFANGKHFYILENERNQNAAFKASVRSQNRGGASVERKGMSDTRFLENGKYFYDLENEQNQYGGRHDNKFDYEKDGFNMVEEYERNRHNQYDP
ncbi:unnamed protein product [Rhodiola kirilowii]